MAINLDQLITVPRASDYPTAERPAAVLPIVYGDWTGNGRTGLIPCTQIDTTTGVYTPASHPVTVVKVFRGDKEVDESEYSLAAAQNYAGAGRLITTIRFFEAQEDPISVTCTGLTDGLDVLIDNPYEARLHFLRTYGDVQDSDLDVGSFSEAATRCTSLGYTFRAFIDSDKDIKSILSTWDQDVLGSYRVRSDGRLRVQVLTAEEVDVFRSQAVIEVGVHCLGGEDGATYIQDRENILNTSTFQYAYNPVKREYDQVAQDQRSNKSVNLYGERREDYDLSTVLTETHVTALKDQVFQLFDGVTRDVWVAQLRLKSFEWPNLEPFDYVILTDRLGPYLGGRTFTNEQFQVLNFAISRESIELDLVGLVPRV